jgi:nucleoside-diphosphate-sugar epimerase
LLATTNPINYSALINFGTSSEYGRKDKPMNEEDLLEPDTLYAASKAGATLLARAWTKIYDKPIVTVRPFSVYGPEDDWGKFIMTVINCIHSRKTLTLAKGVHDWIYINDFIDGILTVVNHAHTLRGRVINIGTGVQYTNEEVVRIAEKVIGKKAKVQEANLIRSYDTTVSWVADNKLLKTLGWQPKFDLRKGIEETVKYYLPE